MAKVASFIPNFWTLHLETDIELIKKHVEAGDEVRVYVCDGELPSCYGNLAHENETCKMCFARRTNAFELLGLKGKIEVVNFVNLTEEDKQTVAKYRGLRPQSLDELRAVQLEGCMMGKAAFNEIASHLRESHPSIEKNADYFERVLEAAAMTYLSFKNNIRDWRPDMFYTFNGRFVVANAALAAAKAAGIGYAVHDRGFRQNVYSLVVNGSLHALDSWSERIRAHWEASADSIDKRIELGSKWFEERIAGTNASLFSFTNDQNVELPANFDPNKYNVVFYNTSEFETVGMDDYKLPFYESQNAGIERIAQDLQDAPNVMLYLRSHPNLKGRNNTQTKFIEERLTNRFPNFEVIPPDSPIKTYGIMSKADAVITFGSTTGAEAVFLRRPSILLGPSPYRDLGACYVPNSHEELIDTLKNQKLKLTPEELEERRRRAAAMGYYMVTGGTDFVYFVEDENFEIWEKSTHSKIGWHLPNEEEVETFEAPSTPPPNPLHHFMGRVKRKIKQLLPR